MKTSAAAPARPLTVCRNRLRRLAVVGVLAPVVALAACSGESAVTADPTAPGGTSPAATSAPATSAASSSATSSSTSTSTSTLPVDKTVSTAINATIKDPDLGHTITATRIVRHFSWPSQQPVGAKSFEIVGVWVNFSAGSRYSASLDPSMLSLVATSPSQNVVPTTEFANRWGATPLKAAKRAQTTGGWVFFKVNRGTTNALSLAFNRPAYQVSTTDKNIGAKTFSVVLTK